jgi:hypothetical protein
MFVGYTIAMIITYWDLRVINEKTLKINPRSFALP